MKKILFSAAALVLAFAAGSAVAAGLPSQNGPPPFLPLPPQTLWSGFYAGLNAGYGWGANSQAAITGAPISDYYASQINSLNFRNTVYTAYSPAGFSAFANSGTSSVSQDGFIGGGQIGYNYQLEKSFVVGFEADFQRAAIRGTGNYVGASQDTAAGFDGIFTGSATRSAIGGGSVSAGVDWLGTVRARIGWLATPMLLVYGTGGLAYGGAHASANHFLFANFNPGGDLFSQAGFFPFDFSTVGGSGSNSGARLGWTGGGGLEWMFMSNWSAKVEALYYDLGSAAIASSPVISIIPFTGDIAAVTVPITRLKFDGIIARAGVNCHFNWGAAPIVAKY